MIKKGLAVIGYGGMGGGFHCKKALASDVVELLGVYDTDPEKLKRAEGDGIHAYKSLDELLSDERVEIVTVAIPNDFHKDTVIRCLNAGKNVICEKPVALCLADLNEMIAASEKAGKLFTVHQNRRWDTDMLRIKALYEKGELGRISVIESRVHGSRGIPSDWRKTKEHGGGMVYDWGVHLIDQALCVIPDSPVVSVYCNLDYLTTSEVDDGCHITLLFGNGVRYFVEIATSNFIELSRFYMTGMFGSALITTWEQPMKVTVLKKADENDATPIRAESGLTKTMAPRDETTTYSYEVPMPKSDVHDFYRNFCRAIDGKETQTVTHAQMRRVISVIEAAFESARTGEAVKRII